MKFRKEMNEYFAKAADAVLNNKQKFLPGYEPVIGTQTKYGEIIEVADAAGFLTVCTMPDFSGGPYWFLVFVTPEKVAQTAAVPKSGTVDVLKWICRDGGFYMFTGDDEVFKYTNFRDPAPREKPDDMII